MDNIKQAYMLLLTILLSAEGNQHFKLPNDTNNLEKTSIYIPSILVPLLYVASNAVQMAVSFLPYYIKQQFFDSNNKETISDLTKKIIHDENWFTQDVYPELLKFILSDSMRTFPIIEYPLEDNIITSDDDCRNIILYDNKITNFPPYYGTKISDIQTCDTNKNYYLIGDITPKSLDKLSKIMRSQIIHGITPENYFEENNNWQYWLHKRLNFFSNTVLAGTINMQIPFIEHHFQAGLSPISFYYLLYQVQNPKIIIQNSLCLLNNKLPNPKINDYLNYKRLWSHTDLIDKDELPHHFSSKKNYLTILSIIG